MTPASPQESAPPPFPSPDGEAWALLTDHVVGYAVNPVSTAHNAWFVADCGPIRLAELDRPAPWMRAVRAREDAEGGSRATPQVASRSAESTDATVAWIDAMAARISAAYAGGATAFAGAASARRGVVLFVVEHVPVVDRAVFDALTRAWPTADDGSLLVAWWALANRAAGRDTPVVPWLAPDVGRAMEAAAQQAIASVGDATAPEATLAAARGVAVLQELHDAGLGSPEGRRGALLHAVLIRGPAQPLLLLSLAAAFPLAASACRVLVEELVATAGARPVLWERACMAVAWRLSAHPDVAADALPRLAEAVADWMEAWQLGPHWLDEAAAKYPAFWHVPVMVAAREVVVRRSTASATDGVAARQQAPSAA